MTKSVIGKKVATAKRKVDQELIDLHAVLSGETWGNPYTKDELIHRVHTELIYWKNNLHYWQSRYLKVSR